MVIAGGMTSKLTYDGVDVCASRVAWEVRRASFDGHAEAQMRGSISRSRSSRVMASASNDSVS